MKRAIEHSHAKGHRRTDPACLADKNNHTASIKEGVRAHSQMQKEKLQHRETLLLEVLLSGLDSRESAKEARSSMLIYLSDLLVTRAREELEKVRVAIDRLDEGATNGDRPA